MGGEEDGTRDRDVTHIIIKFPHNHQLTSSNIIMLGRLVHYTVDAVLVSTVIAGVRRSSGFSSVYSAWRDQLLF